MSINHPLSYFCWHWDHAFIAILFCFKDVSLYSVTLFPITCIVSCLSVSWESFGVGFRLLLDISITVVCSIPIYVR